MKGILIYLSKHGTTEKVARQMQNLLGDEFLLVNLKTTKLPELSEYDTIVIGGSIHAGSIQKEIHMFCKCNLPLLLQKRVGLFLSCMYEGKVAKQQFNAAFSNSLIAHAKTTAITGGEFLFSEMSWIEKVIVRKIVGVKESQSKIDSEAITSFVTSLKN
jgi:menaquinone-dependent protoporphyrinogen oxidase